MCKSVFPKIFAKKTLSPPKLIIQDFLPFPFLSKSIFDLQNTNRVRKFPRKLAPQVKYSRFVCENCKSWKLHSLKLYKTMLAFFIFEFYGINGHYLHYNFFSYKAVKPLTMNAVHKECFLWHPKNPLLPFSIVVFLAGEGILKKVSIFTKNL